MDTFYVIRDMSNAVPYWSADYTLEDAKKRYKRLTGKMPSKKATISIFKGEIMELDKIQVNDLGDILYPKTVEFIGSEL